MGEETALLNNVIPAEIIIQIIDASFYLKDIVTSRADGFTVQARANLMQRQQTSRIDKINENLKKDNLPWVAGETSISKLSYQEKKAYFGDSLPNLNGFEYYVGGIYVMPGALDDAGPGTFAGSEPEASASQYVNEFDWRNRHGQNWVTPVKNQGGCGSCWAFAAAGATELLVNLYYNRHLDFDLSEQQLLSCSGAGTCLGGWPNSALNYIRNSGITNEECFPYSALDLPCSQNCMNPSENIHIGEFTSFSERTVDNLKKMVLRGPVSFGIIPWRHAITLVGYKTLNAGDTIYLKTSDEDRWMTIDNNSPFVGQTAWLIKNSWSTNVG